MRCLRLAIQREIGTPAIPVRPARAWALQRAS
jgi:hypothetical protein